MDDLYPLMLPGVPVADRACVIPGTVVHHDNFKLPIALGKEAVQTTGKILSDIISCHDHGNQLFL